MGEAFLQDFCASMSSCLADRIQQLAVFAAQGCAFQQIGPVSEGLAQLLLAAPAADGLMVAVEQGLGDFEAGKFGWAGVVGVIQ